MFDLYLHDFMHCIAATLFAGCFIVSLSRCTGFPIKLAGGCAFFHLNMFCVVSLVKSSLKYTLEPLNAHTVACLSPGLHFWPAVISLHYCSMNSFTVIILQRVKLHLSCDSHLNGLFRQLTGDVSFTLLSVFFCHVLNTIYVRSNITTGF